MLYVVDMGADSSHITDGARQLLHSVGTVVIKSNLTHIATTLQGMGVPYISCDDLYDSSCDFDELNASIVARLQSIEGDCALCVVGQGTYDSTVHLINSQGIDYTAVVGVGVSAPLLRYSSGSVLTFTVDQLLNTPYIDSDSLVVLYIDDIMVATDVKLKLMELYDYDSTMYVTNGCEVSCSALDQLDRLDSYNYMTSILVCGKPLVDKKVFGISDLYNIMRVLRSPDGCPWDRAQTHDSIAQNAVEESYELVDALDKGDIDGMIEELGDVLLQVLFHQAIAIEDGEMESNDIFSRLGHKLVSRHVHVFGSATAVSDSEALDVWEAQKKLEHSIKDTTANIVDVPRGMSAVLRTQKVQGRASKGGYDFVEVTQAVDKLHEEIAELLAATDNADRLMEAGDVLFATINVIRLMGISSEMALVASTNKFIGRVSRCEQLLADRGTTLSQLTAEQFDTLWQEAKSSE